MYKQLISIELIAFGGLLIYIAALCSIVNRTAWTNWLYLGAIPVIIGIRLAGRKKK